MVHDCASTGMIDRRRVVVQVATSILHFSDYTNYPVLCRTPVPLL